ncbi:POL1 protein, partial [Crocuta crocuta]
MNQHLKLQLSKLCQETYLHWDQVLPIALLRIRCSPSKQMGLSPYEILYERPSPIIKGIRRDLNEIGNLTLRQQMQALGSTLNTLHQWVRERLPVSLTTDAHSFDQGDAVWIKEWNVQPLKPLWRGTFTIILFTPTAIKVAKVGPWIHHSRVKLA